MNDAVLELRKKFESSVKRNKAEGLLFSGGLDSGLIASLVPGINAVTITLKGFGEDMHYSRLIAERCHLKHVHKCVDVDEAIEAIPDVIRILKSFDPALPNDMAVYFGLDTACNMGLKSVATGDGSDELFAGYSFMREIEDLESYIRRITAHMNFSSNGIGKFFNIKISQPYMDKEIVDFALETDIALKIREHNGVTHGKWILRKAFEDMLPAEFIWQGKRPLEYGSGMTELRRVISDMVPDKEFHENKTGIKFMSKDHYYYYKIYSDVVGDIPAPEKDEKKCPCCGAGMNKGKFHCRVCGNVLDWRAK